VARADLMRTVRFTSVTFGKWTPGNISLKRLSQRAWSPPDRRRL